MTANFESDDFSTHIQAISDRRDREAFQMVFQKFSEKIYQYGVANGLTAVQASDLVQDVMTVVWNKSHLFDAEKGKASTWIFTIARNLRFDHFRKIQRQGKHISAEEIWPDIPVGDEGDSEHLDQQLYRRELDHMVDELPDEQRETIRHIYLEGLTHEEFAEKFSLPLGTVKSRIRLALKKLKRGLNS